MQFDELCALVGALRDRVAELEAKEAARAERDAKTQVIDGSLGRWREVYAAGSAINTSDDRRMDGAAAVGDGDEPKRPLPGQGTAGARSPTFEERRHFDRCQPHKVVTLPADASRPVTVVPLDRAIPADTYFGLSWRPPSSLADHGPEMIRIVHFDGTEATVVSEQPKP